MMNSIQWKFILNMLNRMETRHIHSNFYIMAECVCVCVLVYLLHVYESKHIYVYW